MTETGPQRISKIEISASAKNIMPQIKETRIILGTSELCERGAKMQEWPVPRKTHGKQWDPKNQTWLKKGHKRIDAGTRMLLVSTMMGLYETRNAMRIARLIKEHTGTGVSRHSVSRDLEAIERLRPVLYEAMQRSHVKRKLRLAAKLKKEEEHLERQITAMRTQSRPLADLNHIMARNDRSNRRVDRLVQEFSDL